MGPVWFLFHEDWAQLKKDVTENVEMEAAAEGMERHLQEGLWYHDHFWLGWIGQILMEILLKMFISDIVEHRSSSRSQ